MIDICKSAHKFRFDVIYSSQWHKISNQYEK